MVADPVVFMVDAVDELDELERLNIQPGLLQHFARCTRCERFPQLEQPAWQRPLSLERLAATPYQQHASVFNHYRTDADQWDQRKFSLHSLLKLQLSTIAPRFSVSVF